MVKLYVIYVAYELYFSSIMEDDQKISYKSKSIKYTLKEYPIIYSTT